MLNIRKTAKKITQTAFDKTVNMDFSTESIEKRHNDWLANRKDESTIHKEVKAAKDSIRDKWPWV